MILYKLPLESFGQETNSLGPRMLRAPFPSRSQDKYARILKFVKPEHTIFVYKSSHLNEFQFELLIVGTRF